MIYTVTPNPGLDYLMSCPKFSEGKLNRSDFEKFSVGGKGINVSIVLKELGEKSKIFGFCAGFTGDELEKRLENAGLCTELVRVQKGCTRVNVKIMGREITEINANGVCPSEDEVETLCQKICFSVKDGDILVLSGSVPKGAAKGMYEHICKSLDGKNVKIVVDAFGDELVSCLKYKPFFIKPNKTELEEILEKELKTTGDIIDGAKKLRNLGAKNVVVSMGGDGALLVSEENEIFTVPAYKISPVSTVGAGDSMVAGIVCGIKNGAEYALKLGNACGAATAESEFLAKREDIFRFFPRGSEK